MIQEALEILVESWKENLPQAQILPISALHGLSIDFILPKILEWLPNHPPYFEKDQLTNRNMRFFIAEIIREKILLSTILLYIFLKYLFSYLPVITIKSNISFVLITFLLNLKSSLIKKK